jgi:hypothetical protein
VTVDLFEAIKATGQALVRSLTSLMDKYGSKKKKIVYVKDEGFTFNAMISTLNLL